MTKLYSTFQERYNHTPKSRGIWTGERGNSIFIPFDIYSDVINKLNKYNLNGITYIDGCVDFSKCSVATIAIPDMSKCRYKNFAACNEKCAIYWNSINFLDYSDWTSSSVKKYREQNCFTWHERNDCVHCDLVPTIIHSFFTHLGGVSECRHRDNA